MSPAPAQLRCADAADERDDPRVGSASPVSRWLLVEQPGPWGRDALTSSRLDPEVASTVQARALAADVRVLLIRRHGRSGRTGRHLGAAGREPVGRRWAVVDSSPGAEAVRWGRFARDAELLDVDLAMALPASGSVEPLFLVCAHSRHDTCCAVRGRPLAAALDALAPGSVWECSHVGGCRFAANLVVLPYGLFYGGVAPAAAADLVAATRAGRLVPGSLRGRSSLSPAAQVAEHHARTRLGDPTEVDALTVLAERATQDGARVVELLQPSSGRAVQVTVRMSPAGPPVLLTCQARRAAPPPAWQLVDLREV